MGNRKEKYENDRFLRNPPTVKQLAIQITLASDQYVGRVIQEKDFRELIIYYANNHSKKFFSFSEVGKLNATLINRIGKKRAELVLLMLAGQQLGLY